MRQIILDTETTGLKVEEGHRLIEIGCIEIINRRKTGRKFHEYLNPNRKIDEAALKIHGISDDFLADRPMFAEIAERFIDFVRDSELVIHNAPFDVGFINQELSPLGLGKLEEYTKILDTLVMARELYPGQKNNLDSLCERHAIKIERVQHNAYLDAQILLEVYLAMTGGQIDMHLDHRRNHSEQSTQIPSPQQRQALVVIKATEIELAEHHKRLEAILAESAFGIT